MPDKLTVVADLLKVVIGEDPNRGGLIETPIRVAKAWQHWAGGYKEDPAEILKTFEDGAEDYNQIILVKDIPVYSHCEHHLAPFFGVAHVAYIPDGKIVGLSKLSRVVDVFARRLQVQERLTSQVANAIQDALQPKAVGVIIECRHMCMESRGIQRQGASTVTSAMKGLFEWDRSAKEELLDLVRR
jgi:GTP cyclohydrolase I